MFVTVGFNLYCHAHIVYCKWQQYREEKENLLPRNVLNKPVSILHNERPISRFRNERSTPVSAPEEHINLNTLAYNKILADVKHIILFLVFLSNFTSIKIALERKSTLPISRRIHLIYNLFVSDVLL